MDSATLFTRRLLVMALALAVLSAVLTPAVVFSLGYGVFASELATKAEIKGAFVGHLAEMAPEEWTQDHGRLATALSRGPGTLEAEHALLLADDGTVLAEAGVVPGWPVLRRHAVVTAAGVPVARLVLTRSMAPLLRETGWATAAGLALGSAFFALLWTAPVRTLRRVARSLREEKDRLATTLRSIADAVATTDPDGRMRSLNPAGERLLGWAAPDAVGRPAGEVLVLEDDVTGAPLDLAAILRGAANRHGEVAARLVTRSGRRIAVQVSAAAVRSAADAAWGHVLVLHDVDEVRRLSRQLEWQASHDPLTELANRREFEHHLAAALAGVRERGERHALLFMDLDQFKVVNDTCGHIAGDQLLRQITRVLRAGVRQADCLARVGGDEFALLLTHCPRDKAEEIAAALLDTVAEERFAWADKIFSVGMSIGLVEVTPAFADGAALLSAADSACYAAKEKGKGRVQVYFPDDATLKASSNQMACISRITRALDDGRFVLYFQPYLALGGEGGHDGREHGEVLLRMIDEDNRIVPPGAFIPAAERYDLMVRLDHWVIAESFAQYSRLPAAARQSWSINLSGQSLSHDELLAYIVTQAERFGVPPAGICFEVTETAAINNLAHARTLIGALRRKGFRFALDDFGSGLSSFKYLKQLPIDYLKIDGGFVRGLLDDPLDRAMVSAAHEIARILDIRTVAEFVESEAVREELRAIGIDYAQGYAVARPAPLIGHVNALLAQRPVPSAPTRVS